MSDDGVKADDSLRMTDDSVKADDGIESDDSSQMTDDSERVLSPGY